MKKQNILPAISFISIIILSGCSRDDNEPMPLSTVSRLYVSNADIDAAVPNTLIFDPADQVNFTESYKYNSLLPDANGIFFDAFSGVVFQVSRKNKNIKTFSVKTDGTLTNKNSFIDEGLTSARAIAYDRIRDLLYVASNTDSAIYVYNKPGTLTSTVTANKKLKLNGQPWGIHLVNDRLFVVIDQDRAEVQLFDGASSLTIGTIIPTKKIMVSGAKRLHGINYSETRNALILTDIGESVLPGFDTDGAVYIIEQAFEKFTAAGTAPLIIPTRAIKGLNTNLGNPVDLAWDDRTGKDLIYVAEKAKRKIMVFKFADSGDIKPSVFVDLSTSPEAIYLDAR